MGGWKERREEVEKGKKGEKGRENGGEERGRGRGREVEFEDYCNLTRLSFSCHHGHFHQHYSLFFCGHICHWVLELDIINCLLRISLAVFINTQEDKEGREFMFWG